MLYTKEQVRDNIRNRQGKRVFFLGKDDRLTSEARDYLTGQRIEILPASEAKKDSYALLTGGVVYEKPEYMTHLNGDVLVMKNHPRIQFRGMVDLLEGEILLCQKSNPHVQKDLQEILELARRLIRCDVMEEPVGEFTLGGLSQQEQRKRSHFPKDYYGIPHFMPECSDEKIVLELNRLRALTRRTELAAMNAFTDRDGRLLREDIVKALNRMSSMLYILMLREKAKQ